MDQERMKCYIELTSIGLNFRFFLSAQFARQIDGCSQNEFISETFDQRFGGAIKTDFPGNVCCFLMRSGTIWEGG